MQDKLLLVRNFYGSGKISESSLCVRKSEDEIRLPFPTFELDDKNPCKFVLIIEEVTNELQPLLGSNALGEQIASKCYESISISLGDRLVYSHKNHYALDILASNATNQKALLDKVLEDYASYTKTNDVLNGEYNIKIQVYQRNPREPQLMSHEAPYQLTDYEQKIKTITICILLFSGNYDIAKNDEQKHISVFGGFGHLGFFMTDLALFGNFIRRETNRSSANLIELFTSSDLVDKCFSEGLLVITWGIKPWHYYITTDHRLLNPNSEEVIKGSYKLRSDIKELSVIPGNELANWPACMERKWPIIRLEGIGEKVYLSLHLEHGKLGNELIAKYFLQRKSEEIKDIDPIINYSFI